MTTTPSTESDVSQQNYKDNKQFYKKEFVDSTNLLVGIGILIFIILKK